MTQTSPLDGLDNRSFWNFKEINTEKNIEIWPWHKNNPYWDNADLRKDGNRFVTIPPAQQGSYVVRHQVPPDKIANANIQKGESYRVALTDLCLGVRWWTYGDLKDLDGFRFRMWRSQIHDDKKARKMTELKDQTSANVYAQLEKEWQNEEEQYHKEGPTITGEEPDKLAMVSEVKVIEFQVV